MIFKIDVHNEIELNYNCNQLSLQLKNTIPGRSKRRISIFCLVRSLRNHFNVGGAFRTNLINASCGMIFLANPYFALRIDTRSRTLQHLWNRKVSCWLIKSESLSTLYSLTTESSTINTRRL